VEAKAESCVDARLAKLQVLDDRGLAPRERPFLHLIGYHVSLLRHTRLGANKQPIMGYETDTVRPAGYNELYLVSPYMRLPACSLVTLS
jgi:hypothetical protein